jgi:hypothetical protein
LLPGKKLCFWDNCFGENSYLLFSRVGNVRHQVVPISAVTGCGKAFACLTLPPPAVKTQWLYQCQTFQRLVRSSHTLVKYILNNFWSNKLIFNQFSVFLKTLTALCVFLQYKHPRSIKKSLGQTSQSLMTLVFPVKLQKCDFGAKPRCRLFATSAGKGLIKIRCLGYDNYDLVCLSAYLSVCLVWLHARLWHIINI